MESMVGQTVVINEGAFTRCDYAVTNKLKCSYCSRKVAKGTLVLLTYTERKLYSVNCGKCEVGEEELSVFESEVILVEVNGMGQY